MSLFFYNVKKISLRRSQNLKVLDLMLIFFVQNEAKIKVNFEFKNYKLIENSLYLLYRRLKTIG